eukprot:INCI2697.2.p1 GENE.INCI2697.2~~INCI2697.2.p1  ORF type:complete len:188 (+),score=42.67 INCI2697.2:208-771(+)
MASRRSKGPATTQDIVEKRNQRVKIISLGDSKTGKSCLIKRFCEDKFVNKYLRTIGVDFGVKPVKIDGRSVKVNFWDLSGHDEFFQVRNEFYKDSQGGLLVFDASSRASFENLVQWVKEAKEFGGGKLLGLVVANKTDLKRAVSDKEASAWARQNGYAYAECSAKSGENVQQAFLTLINKVVQKYAS